MLGKIGPMELAIIIGIVVLIFGPRQLPKLGRSLGETIREVRGIRKHFDEGAREVSQTASDITDTTKEALGSDRHTYRR